MSRCYCIGGNPCPCVKQQQEGFLSKIIENKRAEMRTEKEIALEMAIQQFTGYLTGSQGHGVMELVGSMGLTKNEWLQIRDELTLLPCDIKEIDELFKVGAK